MRFSRARYVTLCQQSLVTAAVLAVGVSAAGVKTLDIVPQPGSSVGVPESSPAAQPQSPQAQRRPKPRTTEVDVAPVTPTVREVEVSGIADAAPRARRAPSSKQGGTGTAPEQDASRDAGTGTGKSAGKSTGKASGKDRGEDARTAPGERAATEEQGSKRLVALTAPEKVSGYATVGVTWKAGVRYDDERISVEVRTQDAGQWSDWMPAEYHDEHGPDGVEARAAADRPGTDALVIGDVDRVQMRTSTTDGSTPPDLRLAVIDPGEGELAQEAPAIDTATLSTPAESDQASLSASGFAATDPATEPTEPTDPGATDPAIPGVDDTVSLSGMKVAPRPYIYSRAQWGANERMRDQSAPSYGTVKTGFIHHTVNANNYTSAQVPSLLRGIYAYHTQSRGWRDVGYNFLVDRFGRIWEGRYGGVTRSVVGAHTLGYNEYSFAMSAIGNFDIASPPQAVVDAYSRLMAWKLSIAGVRASATRLYVKNRYLPAINGHRDVGQTACPGRYLYAKLPAVRAAAQRIQDAAQAAKPAPAPPPPPAPKPEPKPEPEPEPAPEPPSDEFTSPTQTPRPAMRQPAGISFPSGTNLAGSEHPDLVLKSRATGAIRVLPTGGQTGFGRAITSPGNWGAMDLVTAVGDVTGDGHGDVVARAARNGVARVYQGDGAGRVRVRGIQGTLRFRSADLLISAGDWDRDGHNDVLMRTRASGSLYLVPGTGTGAWKQPRRLSRVWGSYTSTAVIGDITGDDRPDVVGISRGALFVVPSTAEATLARRIKRQDVGESYDALMGGAGDLDSDGVGDVVVRSTRTGALGILTGRSDASFGRMLGHFGGLASRLSQLSGGNLTGSAHPDVLGVSRSGRYLVVVPSNGLRNATGSLPTNLRVAAATQVLSVGDWNRDGKGDVITRENDGDVLKLRPGKGDGQFGRGTTMSSGWASFTHLGALGDVTGDQVPDLVGKTASGATTIFPGDGAKGFQAPRRAPATLRTFNQIAAGAWRPGGLPGSAFLSSDGSFVPFAGSVAGDLGRYDWVIGPGDVDGNGVHDLVVRDRDGVLWLLPGTSKGYLDPRFLASGYQGYSLGG